MRPWVSRLLALPPAVFSDLASAAGHDVASLKDIARSSTFTALALNATLTAHTSRTDRAFTSSNVLALLPGTDPARRDDVVIYTSHWDHLGPDRNHSGDQIYSGAIDNAGDIAQLLELARAFSRHPPKRSVLFIATTAEEEGMLGSFHYVAHPVYPLDRTVAAINLDLFWPFGRMNDLVEFSAGNTSFDDVVSATAAALNRRVIPIRRRRANPFQ